MELLPDFRILRPRTVAEAVAAWQANPDSRFLAGGTDLLVNLRRGLGQPAALIELTAVAEMRSLAMTADGGLRIGASVPLAALARDAKIVAAFPGLVQAAEAVAGPTHREMGTVGGNLCLDTRCIHYNQSEWWRESNDFCLKYQGEGCRVVPSSDRCHAMFSGDLAPALLVLEAEVETVGPLGGRRFPLDALYRDDGMNYLTLAAGEVLVAVHVGPCAGWRSGYAKVRIREAIDFPLVGVAAAVKTRDGVMAGMRVACTATNSRPLLIAEAHQLVGRPLDAEGLQWLSEAMLKHINPVKTTVVTPKYRRRVATAVMRRLVARLYAA